MPICDVHANIVSPDDARYPRLSSAINSDGPTASVEDLLADMDAAGVDRAAVVQRSSTYGYDNSYLLDSVARAPNRLTAVVSIDMSAPNAPALLEKLAQDGVSGVRVYTGGAKTAGKAPTLDDPLAYHTWAAAAEMELPICLQTGLEGLEQVSALAHRFPNARIVLDNAARIPLKDGPPFIAAHPVLRLAEMPGIYLKLTPRTFLEANTGEATPEKVFPMLVGAFGAERLTFGSGYPTRSDLKTICHIAREALSCLGEEACAMVMGGTALHLYPTLADER